MKSSYTCLATSAWTIFSISLIAILLLSKCSRAASETSALRRETNSSDGAIQSSTGTSKLLMSPTPDDYLNLHNFACGHAENGSRTPVSREELIRHYSTSDNERLKQVAAAFEFHKECRREPTSWRFNYIDEAGLVWTNERSIDERAANVLYVIRAVKPFGVDLFNYDWQDPELNRANMDRVTGPKFDDDLCGKQLGQMLELARELEEISQLSRLNSSRSTGSDQMERRLTDQHISLAKILDSYGRQESGRLMGKIYLPGSYHQCLWNNLILDENTTVDMRYCWAHLNYEHRLTETLRLRQRRPFEYPLNVLYAGMCLPESCHSKSFARHKDLMQKLIDTQFQQPLGYIDKHLNMTSLFCLVDPESDFRIPLAGKCLLATIFGWFLTTLIVTIYNSKMGYSKVWQEQRQSAKLANLKTRPEREHAILRSLDLYESWQGFQEYYWKPTHERPVQLDAMNFFKVFGCGFVVIGHTMALSGGYSLDEIRTARYIESDVAVCLIVAGTLIVDTFFVISGILWSYLALKRLKKLDSAPGGEVNRPGSEIQLHANISGARPSIVMDQVGNLKSKQSDGEILFDSARKPETSASQMSHDSNQVSWPQTIKTFCGRWFLFSLSRYLRIVPLFVLVHWFKKYVFIYIGEGPFWDHGLNYKTMVGSCHKESPLTPFTFMSAYYPIARQCTLQSWSVSNDIFFALLAPPVILLISKRPKVAAWLTFVSCLASYYSAMDKVGSFPTELDEELRELRAIGFYRIFDEMSIIYTAPHLRIFCFLIGVWAGYCLYQKQAKLSKQLARFELQKQHEGDETGQNQVRVELPPARINDNQSNHEGTANINRGRIEWPHWFHAATFASTSYILFIFVCFALNDNSRIILGPYRRLIYPQFTSGFRIMWALANAILLIRMMTDWKDTLLMRWSASKFWQACSKLCLPILLIHLDLLLYTTNVQPSLPISFTKWTFVNLGAGILMLCIPLAIFIHVVYEMPFDKLIRSRVVEIT